MTDTSHNPQADAPTDIPVTEASTGEPQSSQESSQAEQTAQTASAQQATQSTSEATGEPTTEVSLETQLAEAQAKAAEYLDGWQRARADFINFRKRADQERTELYTTASVDTLRKILPVIDDFDRAIGNVPSERANDDVIKGFQLIHRKFATLLEGAGITVINPVGAVFDPKYHEAIGQDESTEVDSGHVTVVLQKGYLHGDKVLRPALVRVAG